MHYIHQGPLSIIPKKYYVCLADSTDRHCCILHGDLRFFSVGVDASLGFEGDFLTHGKQKFTRWCIVSTSANSLKHLYADVNLPPTTLDHLPSGRIMECFQNPNKNTYKNLSRTRPGVAGSKGKGKKGSSAEGDCCSWVLCNSGCQ